MGYVLRREIRDVLPRGGILTDKEARLLLEAADFCRDETREGWPGSEWLAEKADLSDPSRVGEFFASIAEKWVEFRVPLGKNKRGEPYYSYPGKRTTFRFPSKAELEATPARKVAKKRKKVPESTGPNLVPESTGPKVPYPRGPYGPGTSAEWSRNLRDPSPQFPSVQPSSLSSGPRTGSPYAGHQVEGERADASQEPQDQIRAVLTEHGCPPAGFDVVIEYCDRLPGGPKGPGWYVAVGRAGHLAGHIADALRPAPPKTMTYPEWRTAVADHPSCRHGEAGGDQPMPDNGWMPCAPCRIGSGWINPAKESA